MLKKVISLSLLVTIVTTTLTGCIYINNTNQYKGKELYKLCMVQD